MQAPPLLPVTVLTGFLGSGKTTVLARLLRQPAFARTAVIINEFGEIGLDHDLVAASSESLIELETGCLCCAVRGDLALTLADLLARRDAGSVPPFERVVIETSGMADPAPVLQLLMTDNDLAARLALAGVVTTVDAETGLATLEREPQAPRQVAVADRLIVTKTDLAGGLPPPLAERLWQLNPGAAVLSAIDGAVDGAWLLAAGGYRPAHRLADVQAWLAASDGPPPGHGGDIAAIAITRDRPLHAVTLTLLVETLAEHCGRDLLRLKGIIDIVESPDRPAVIHAVQHVVHPVSLLDAWPSADRRSRIVLIGRGLVRGWVEALIDSIEAECVNAASGRTDGRGSSPGAPPTVALPSRDA